MLEELKRADHLIYVSLKYTRTVDVIKSIIKRLINAFDYGIDSLLINYQDIQEIEEIPQTPRVKAKTIQKIHENDLDLSTFMDLYVLFRKIDRARFDKAREFRRHVTMTAYLDEGEIELNIDIIGDYFSKTKQFIEYVNTKINNKSEDQ